jgi:phosphatidylinositol-3-phosphatase
MKLVPLAALIAASAIGCSSTGTNTTGGLTQREQPDLQGTIFTIVFENEAATDVFPNAPFFKSLAAQYAQATNYTSSTHPSLPNYIVLTSGATNGIMNDNDPVASVPLATHEHLAYQLDAKGIAWRAYMEGMGTPCKMESSGDYSAHHDPFLYYTDVTKDSAYCDQHVVDFDQNFDADLASANPPKYMWITPNMCNDMHNCPATTADAWLKNVVTKIQASDAYKKGGAIFVLFDEGAMRFLGSTAQLATIVVSEQLATPGVPNDTAFDHRSYVATIEDIFGLDRISTTTNATPMDAFFKLATPPAAP